MQVGCDGEVQRGDEVRVSSQQLQKRALLLGVVDQQSTQLLQRLRHQHTARRVQPSGGRIELCQSEQPIDAGLLRLSNQRDVCLCTTTKQQRSGGQTQRRTCIKEK